MDKWIAIALIAFIMVIPMISASTAWEKVEIEKAKWHSWNPTKHTTCVSRSPEVGKLHMKCMVLK